MDGMNFVIISSAIIFILSLVGFGLLSAAYNRKRYEKWWRAKLFWLQMGVISGLEIIAFAYAFLN